MRRPRILLADDHAQMRRAIRGVLEPAYDVIGAVADGRTLVNRAIELAPDVVLVDVGLPVVNGLAATAELRRLMPQIKIVFLTMDSDPAIRNEAFRIGASGYVLKSAIGEDLLQTIQAATNVDA